MPHPYYEPEEGQLVKYTDYVAAEEAAGREPLPMPEWRAQQMKAARQAKTEEAEKGFSTSPGPIADEPIPTPPAPPTVDELEAYNEQVVKHGPPPAAPARGQLAPDLSEVTTGALIFQCKENRWRVETMQAGDRVLAGGTAVRIPHRAIEFNDWQWTADMENPDHREKAQWLVKSDAWRKGEITLINRPMQARPVAVQTGPRTSSTPRVQNITRAEQPSGELSARIT